MEKCNFLKYTLHSFLFCQWGIVQVTRVEKVLAHFIFKKKNNFLFWTNKKKKGQKAKKGKKKKARWNQSRGLLSLPRKS